MRLKRATGTMLTLTLIVAGRAGADPQTVSRLGWVTNGHAQAAVQVGDTLYIGGTFTRVAPASGMRGAFYRLSTTTGAPVPTFPLVDGVVRAIGPDGAGGWFIGGTFTTVGGQPRSNLAHVFADGSVNRMFLPQRGG